MDTARFLRFQRFYYEDYCNPQAPFSKKMKNFYILFRNRMYNSQYYRDLKAFSEDKKVDQANRHSAKRILFIDNLINLSIFCYIPYSFYSHYKQNWFNTGKYLIDLYIISKILICSAGIVSLAFLITKMRADPLLYPYYLKKEHEWERVRAWHKDEYEYYSHVVDIKK